MVAAAGVAEVVGAVVPPGGIVAGVEVSGVAAEVAVAVVPAPVVVFFQI